MGKLVCSHVQFIFKVSMSLALRKPITKDVNRMIFNVYLSLKGHLMEQTLSQIQKYLVQYSRLRICP
jgi:hypothetical protein